MSIPWATFVEHVESELATGERRYIQLDESFESEQALTTSIALGLRQLYLSTYQVASPAGIYAHVVYRKGSDPEDRAAWTSARDHKWTVLHGARFVPDILVRDLGSKDNVLPIEVKLIKSLACSQDIATAIGQGLAYAVRYGRAIILVGVTRGLTKGRYGLDNLSPIGTLDEALHRRLENNGIRLIFREVGMLQENASLGLRE